MFGIEPGKRLENNVIFSLFCIWSLIVTEAVYTVFGPNWTLYKVFSVLEGITSERNILYESLSLWPLYFHEWKHYRNPLHSESKSHCLWTNCWRLGENHTVRQESLSSLVPSKSRKGFPAWSDYFGRKWGTLINGQFENLENRFDC